MYSNQGNYPEALKKYLLALKNYEYVGSKRGIADAYNKLADIYYWQENYPESLKNYFASLKINEEIGNKEGVALSYYNIGGVYANQDKYEDALKNSRTSLKLYEELGSEVDIADVYVQIASIYGKQGNYPEASKNLLASLKVYEEAGHGVGVATANVSIGDNFLAEAIKNGPAASVKYKQAIQYLHKGLKHATEIGLNETVLRAYESLGEAYKGVNNYKKALEYYSLFVEMKDSLHNNETTRKLEQQRTQYEVEKQ